MPPEHLPVSVKLGNLTEKNVEQLKRLNSALFPVKYNERFYQDAIKAPDGFVQMAYYQDILVGAVLVRLEGNKEEKTNRLYIMTLGVLAPYRGRGIGNYLLNHVFDLCATHSQCKEVTEMSLHVHTANEEAINFYKKRGFEVVELITKYYKRGVEPPDCYLLRKKVEPRQQSKEQ